MTLLANMPSFPETSESQPLIEKYETLASTLEGKHVQGKHASGGADLNYMYRPGVPMLDGLGPIGGGFHTADEFIILASLESRSKALSELLAFAMQTLR